MSRATSPPMALARAERSDWAATPGSAPNAAHRLDMEVMRL
jgi:hypothetical protein